LGSFRVSYEARQNNPFEARDLNHKLSILAFTRQRISREQEILKRV